MHSYDGPIFDTDTHLVETLDAWVRCLPSKYREDYGIEHKVGPDGEFALYIGGTRKVEVGAGYRTQDGKVPPPGSLKEFLLALKNGKDNVDSRVPISADQFERAARIAKLEEFGVTDSIMYCGEHVSTLGYIKEMPVDAAHEVLHAYNRWMLEDWGFEFSSKKTRGYVAPVLHLFDLDKAVEETEWAIRSGARAVVFPLGPVDTRAPGDPYFDPVWSRLNEAGVLVVYHISEATHMHSLMRIWGEPPLQSRLKQSAWTYMNAYGRVPIVQTLSSLIFYNFFERFPNIHVLSAENGAEWVPAMLIDMDKARGMAKNSPWPCGQLKDRPSRIFRKHVSVVAYPEDDLAEVVRQAGSLEWLTMGSDYPHAEGVKTPRHFADEACQGLSAEQVRAVMYDNGRRLINVKGP